MNRPRASRTRNRRRIAVLVLPLDGFGRDLMLGIARFAQSHPAWEIFMDWPEGLAVNQLSPRPTEWEVDGILVRPYALPYLEQVRQMRIPIVNMGAIEQWIRFPSVLVHGQAAGGMAARHLLDRGFRQMAFVGHEGRHYSTSRQTGVERERRAAGIDSPMPVWNLDADAHTFGTQGERSLGRWIRNLRRPTGIVACNDHHALMVVRACRRLGLLVPEDMAVIGTSNDPMVCEFSPVPLSSVDLNTQRVGHEAATLLDSILDGLPPPRRPQLIAPTGVVQRRSSNAQAVADPSVAKALALMQERHREPLTFSDLARDAGLGRRVLERRFRDALGRSPGEMLLRMRIETARALLRDTNLPVEEVAAASGFTHASHFGRHFKASDGRTPGRFRREI